MVVLSKIYTKTGDAGETALGNGARVAKHSIRVSAYGTVDETNATVGLARLHATGDMDAALEAHLERPLRSGRRPLPPRHGIWMRAVLHAAADDRRRRSLRLEARDRRDERKLTPLRSFILPGGSVLAAQLHLCRTVCRRAERLVVETATMEDVNPEAVRYLNRLSDWFFVAGRIANNDGKDDVLWVPGLTR